MRTPAKDIIRLIYLYVFRCIYINLYVFRCIYMFLNIYIYIIIKKYINYIYYVYTVAVYALKTGPKFIKLMTIINSVFISTNDQNPWSNRIQASCTFQCCSTGTTFQRELREKTRH